MFSRYFTVLVAVMLCGACFNVYASDSVDVVGVNLNPLIDRAASHPNRFAVDVPHGISSTSSGHWANTATTSTWTYSIQIPTAVSLSFHATKIVLPKSAVLTVSAAGVSYRYTARNIHGNQLWSRIGRGDRIDLALSVSAEERSQVLVQIASLQAGYRGLGPGAANHPHYEQVRIRATMGSLAGCTENYQCHINTDDQQPGQATMAIVIGNTVECTATLVNDVPGDGVPYVLTARHCENDQPGGGDPSAAASVVAYWDAITPCGNAVASIFSVSTPVTYGAATLVEQQDVWLIRLSQVPPADAYFAGWDASGGAVDNGYTIHHANADTKQYVAWSGNAASRTVSAASLGVGYSGTFWEVVNSVGSIDHGASGSGLFDTGDRMVGTLSRGANQCPANPVPAPSDSTADGLFNSLAAVWTATTDTTSTTGTATLASVLDPKNTGTLSIAGNTLPFTIAFSASSSAAQVGSLITLTWDTGAHGCIASGGAPGDGWSGNFEANSSSQVTETAVGVVTYVLTCTSGTRSLTSQVTVTWTPGPPAVDLKSNLPQPVYLGQVDTLTWTSNLTSCSASGGASGDGWTGSALPPNGSLPVTESTTGQFTYTLTCTDGTQSTQSSLIVFVQATYAFVSSLTGPITLRIGQPVTLSWSGSAPCQGTGGSAGDGWAGPLTSAYAFVTLTENAAGTYNYGITCGPAGAKPASAQVALTFTAAAPSATLTTVSPQQAVLGVPLVVPDNLSWVSNVEPCGITYTGPASGTFATGQSAVGSRADLEQIPGLYTYTLTCGTGADQAQSTATINWTQPTPQVSLSAPTPADAITGQGTYLNWSTNVLPCVGSGGAAGDGWSGPQSYSYYGNSASIDETTSGTYTYTITCGTGSYGTASATIVFNNPGGTTLTLAASNAAPYASQSTTLSWNSKIAPCTAIGGVAGDGWAGSQPVSGSTTFTEPAGTYAYIMVCGTGAQAVQVQTVVAFLMPPRAFVGITENGGNTFTGESTITLMWSGIDGETCNATGGGPGDGWAGPRPPTGSYGVSETQPGTYTYAITCTFFGTSDTESTGLIWILPPPVITFSAGSQAATIGQPVALTWSVTNATACTASGGSAGDGWTGAEPLSGHASVTESAPGTYYYTLTCIDGTNSYLAPAFAEAMVYFSPPGAVTISVDHASVVTGGQFSIAWNGTNVSSCVTSGGATGDGWSGNSQLSATTTLSEATPGTYTFTVQCMATGGGAVSGHTTVTVSASQAGGGSSGSGKGGGGALDESTLAALLLLGSVRFLFFGLGRPVGSE